MTLKATRRLSLRAWTLPLARPASAGESGISVPMRPRAGPALTSSRVRSRRLSERKSKSARPLASRSRAFTATADATRKLSDWPMAALQATGATAAIAAG